MERAEIRVQKVSIPSRDAIVVSKIVTSTTGYVLNRQGEWVELAEAATIPSDCYLPPAT